MVQTLSTSGRYCAFCEYWYDPTRQYTQPVRKGFCKVDFDGKGVCQCSPTGIERPARFSCMQFKKRRDLL